MDEILKRKYKKRKSRILIIEPGTKFGELTVLKYVGIEKELSIYECQCSCGDICKRKATYLKRGMSKRCDKCFQEIFKKVRNQNGRNPNEINIGDKFGKWTVIGNSPRNKYGRITYFCECDCGETQRPIESTLLIYNKTKSCRKCMLVTHGEARHGKETRLYKRWTSMRDRCNSKKNPDYENYGGRGIKVCQRWNSYENFKKDMGEPPIENYQLDRIDPDGNYEPSNCRWISARENIRNRRCSSQHRNKYILVKKDKINELATYIAKNSYRKKNKLRIPKQQQSFF